MNTQPNQEIHHRVLKLLTENTSLTQRDMAKRMGVSLGKTNYCISELAKKGFIKVKRFKESPNKLRYTYAVTPEGMAEKARLTYRFLKTKLREYEEIKRQIKELGAEVEKEDLEQLLSDVE